jgi:hypothetical protein
VTAIERSDRAAGPPLAFWAALGGLGAFLALQAAAVLRAGVFEYPLDDVYIHLSIGAEIARGGYGINAGEPAGAASSILYPFLLAVGPGSEAQRWMPFAWNLAGLAASCLLWARIVGLAGYSGALGAALAFAGPVATGAFAAAYTGMEHALHAAASLGIVYGLALWLMERRLSAVLFISVLLAPLLRFEGLALALLAAGVLVLTGRRGAGALAAALAVLPVAGFAVFLQSLGLDPLPSSVQAKLSEGAGGETGFLAGRIRTLARNLSQLGGVALLGLVLAAVLMPVLRPRLKRNRLGLLALVAAAAGLAHLLLAQVGWMDRYEHYALIALGAAVLLLAGAEGPPRPAPLVLGLLPLALAGYTYVSNAFVYYAVNPQAIHLQQAQMARFAQDYAQTDVAVNDIGRVAWGNDNAVLDLWGLASPEALAVRLGDPAPGWAGPIVAARDVPLVMIYDRWLGDAVSPDWVRLGELRTHLPLAFLGGFRVAFYAADPAAAGRLRAALADFEPTLPEGASFTFAGEAGE